MSIYPNCKNEVAIFSCDIKISPFEDYPKYNKGSAYTINVKKHANNISHIKGSIFKFVGNIAKITKSMIGKVP